MQVEDINRLRRDEQRALYEIEQKQLKLIEELHKQISTRLSKPSIKTNNLLTQLINTIKAS